MAQPAAIIFVALFTGFAVLAIVAFVRATASPSDASGWFLAGLSMVAISCLAIAFAVWKMRR